ncbi:MAG: hypothetical protein ACYDAR_02215 [Thermomicrobiales bacterium]
MNDHQPTSEYIHNHFQRRRRRSFANILVTALVFIFVPVLRGRGHSPLATVLIFILAVAFGGIAIVIVLQWAEYTGVSTLTLQRGQRPGESYWHHYQRYLFAEPSHHSDYRQITIIGCVMTIFGLFMLVFDGHARLGLPSSMIAAGLGLLTPGWAEFLPAGERRPAAILRILGEALMLFALVGFYVSQLW